MQGNQTNVPDSIDELWKTVFEQQTMTRSSSITLTQTSTAKPPTEPIIGTSFRHVSVRKIYLPFLKEPFPINLKKIAEETETEIKIPADCTEEEEEEEEEGSSNEVKGNNAFLIVWGTPVQVQKARDKIEGICEDMEKTFDVRTINVPKVHHARLAAAADDLLKGTGALMQIPSASCLSEAITIRGPAAKIAEACDKVNAHVQHYVETAYVKTSPLVQKYLLDNKATYLKSFLDRMPSVVVEFCEEEEQINVQGSKREDVSKAKEELTAFIGALSKNLIRVEISVDAKAYPHFVGRKLKNLPGYKEKFHVSIDAPGNNIVHLEGLKSDVQAVQEEIDKLTELTKPKKNEKPKVRKRSKGNVVKETLSPVDQASTSCLIKNDVLPEMECPICKAIWLPPIFICQMGHSVCSTCRKKFKNCPKCSKPIEDIHNHTLEILAANFPRRCPNSIRGCSFAGILAEIQAHKSTCTWRLFSCPLSEFNKCTWSGIETTFKAHALQNHVLHLEKINCTTWYRNLRSTLKLNCYLIFGHGEIFKFSEKHLSETKGNVEFSLQIVTSNMASSYMLALDFLDAANSGLNFTITHGCLPLRGKQNEFKNCLQIPIGLLKQYVDEKSGYLNYRLNIIKI